VKASETQLLSFLNKSQQFRIPIYQRTYSWTTKECEQLFEDVMRAGGNSDVNSHFVGSIVYIEKGLYSVSTHHSLMVIDGQQRLTTITLLLEALAREVGEEEPSDGFSAAKIRGYYLIDELQEGDNRFKLLLTRTDKDTLLAIVQNRQLPVTYSARLVENFEFLQEEIGKLSPELLGSFCVGLSKLAIVNLL